MPEKWTLSAAGCQLRALGSSSRACVCSAVDDDDSVLGGTNAAQIQAMARRLDGA